MVRTRKKYLLFLQNNYIVTKVSMKFTTRRKWVMKLIRSKIGQKWCVGPNFILTRGATPRSPIFVPCICYLKYWNSIKWWNCSQVFQNLVSMVPTLADLMNVLYNWAWDGKQRSKLVPIWGFNSRIPLLWPNVLDIKITFSPKIKMCDFIKTSPFMWKLNGKVDV